MLGELEDNLEDSKKILEFVETALLHVYLITNNPLLGPLLRIENTMNYERTVALLLKYNKIQELVGFYRSKGHHQKALFFLEKYF
jgi:adenine C2-methylase RlmN of 23S rRNA A2503 and tRNA A37